MFNCQNKICDGSKINFKGVFIDEKHLQKYLFEEKVCNLVTEISSKETGGIPEPNTNVILKENYRADRRRFFLPAYS